MVTPMTVSGRPMSDMAEVRTHILRMEQNMLASGKMGKERDMVS